MKKKLKLKSKYEVSEFVYNLAYSQGYRTAYEKSVICPYGKESPLRKIWLKGKRDAKKIY